ncbi:sodium ion-translocating decarboxylase subunit beta, partial [Salmonella enterica subsp. enterica serovar Anatum]|nr:sodium ion-translocating decarboxylase subunit beta [Salmonella enterica subsp. enterica serovar Anatum]
LLLPDAAPLLGMFCFGNLMRESGVVERLSDTVQNGLINIVTIFLGLSVGAKLVADKFLQPQTLGILLLGVIAFGIGTAAGVLMAKLLNLCSKNRTISQRSGSHSRFTGGRLRKQIAEMERTAGLALLIRHRQD